MSTDDWSRELTTRTGFRFAVRPARPDDEAALAEFFTHVTLDDLLFRFLTTVKQVSADQLAAMTQFDRRRTENFLAFADGSPAVIATAMLVCDDALEVGEVAIAIRAEDKNKGVGWELLRHITRYAEAKGVKSLESLESRANHQAIALEKELGFVAQPYPDDASLVLVRRQLKAA